MLLSRSRKIALTLICTAPLMIVSVQPVRAQIDTGGVADGAVGAEALFLTSSG
jgi:hypothetical protein